MNWALRQGTLGEALAACRPLWHAQPFREIRPAWSEAHPALAAELLALDDGAAEHLNGDGAAARSLVARHLPQVAAFDALLTLVSAPPAPAPDPGRFWDWEIPGRKRSQIVAFAAAARHSGRPLLDWCGGKGHLGRLLALHWQVPATSLDRDATLCAEGEALARRSGATQRFVTADALQAEDRLGPDQHVVALHACGDLHRHALRVGSDKGVAAFDLAPCCYHRGVLAHYRPLALPFLLLSPLALPFPGPLAFLPPLLFGLAALVFQPGLQFPFAGLGLGLLFRESAGLFLGPLLFFPQAALVLPRLVVGTTLLLQGDALLLRHLPFPFLILPGPHTAQGKHQNRRPGAQAPFEGSTTGRRRGARQGHRRHPGTGGEHLRQGPPFGHAVLPGQVAGTDTAR